MTPEQAYAAGYRVIRASDCEVGLVKGDEGIKTWWCSDFGGRLPSLYHPEIQKTVTLHETLHG